MFLFTLWPWSRKNVTMKFKLSKNVVMDQIKDKESLLANRKDKYSMWIKHRGFCKSQMKFACLHSDLIWFNSVSGDTKRRMDLNRWQINNHWEKSWQSYWFSQRIHSFKKKDEQILKLMAESLSGPFWGE